MINKECLEVFEQLGHDLCSTKLSARVMEDVGGGR